MSSTAMPDIYLIYSLPKLQSKACLLKSAVCCSAWHDDKSHTAALSTVPFCQEWPVSIEREEKWKQRRRVNVKYGGRERKWEREGGRERKANATFYKQGYKIGVESLFFFFLSFFFNRHPVKASRYVDYKYYKIIFNVKWTILFSFYLFYTRFAILSTLLRNM